VVVMAVMMMVPGFGRSFRNGPTEEKCRSDHGDRRTQPE
jgi:hypothetical protein